MLFMITKPQLSKFAACPETATEADIDRAEAYWKQWPLGPALNLGEKFFRKSVRSQLESWAETGLGTGAEFFKLLGEVLLLGIGLVVLLVAVPLYTLLYLPVRGLYKVMTHGARQNISEDIEVVKKWAEHARSIAKRSE